HLRQRGHGGRKAQQQNSPQPDRQHAENRRRKQSAKSPDVCFHLFLQPQQLIEQLVFVARQIRLGPLVVGREQLAASAIPAERLLGGFLQHGESRARFVRAPL